MRPSMFDETAMAALFGRDYQTSKHVLPQSNASNTIIIFKSLEELLQLGDDDLRFRFYYAIAMPQGQSREVLNTLTAVLSPKEIQNILKCSIAYENHTQYGTAMGLLVSKLITNSYNAGYNQFVLDIRNLKPLHQLACGLNAHKSGDLTIIIHGKAGDGCAHNSNATFYIEEAMGLCGSFSKGTIYAKKVGDDSSYWASSLTMYVKEAGNSLGKSSQNSKFYIIDAGSYMGNDSDSTFYCKGKCGLKPYDSHKRHSVHYYFPRRNMPFLAHFPGFFNQDPRRSYLPKDEWNQVWSPAKKAFRRLDQVLGESK